MGSGPEKCQKAFKVTLSYAGTPPTAQETASAKEKDGQQRVMPSCLRVWGEQRWVSVSLTETRVPINRSEVASNRGLETVALSKQGAAERFDGRKGRCAGQYGVMGSHSGVLLWTHQHFCIES